MTLRRFIVAASILLLIILAVGVYFVTQLDNLVEARIERTGSRVAGVPVTVDSADISITDGSAKIFDLEIANPAGFSDRPALRFAEIGAQIKFRDHVITRVYSVQPDILIEGTLKRTNIDVLRGNIAAFAGPQAAAAGQTATNSTNGANKDKDKKKDENGDENEDGDKKSGIDKDATVLQIELFELIDARVQIEVEEVGEPITLVIDFLQLRNLKGTRSDIAHQILNKLTYKIMDEVRNRLRDTANDAIKAEAKVQAEKLGDKLRNKLNKYLEQNTTQ
ncbi:MAG: hypothetical protein DHS20C01_10750 [marine bacterium B5-7]|nr:MAG: hypothetical protein DHS20C01_10750 [marine bacterium B5-7]